MKSINTVFYGLLALLSFLTFSCTKNTESKDQTSNPKVVEQTSSEQLVVPDSLFGYYINMRYLGSLEETKSTRESQEASPLSMVEIYKSGTSSFLRTAWNFHEGGADDTLVMTGERTATVVASDGKDNFGLHINSGKRITIRAGTNIYELVKWSTNATDFQMVANSAVNSTLFADDYILGDKKVKFTKGGEIIGLDSLVSFEVATDYIDAGMSFDKIYFRVKGKKHLGIGDEYGYEFNQDTLNIFRVICLKSREDDPTSCEEDAKGPTAFKLVRK